MCADEGFVAKTPKTQAGEDPAIASMDAADHQLEIATFDKERCRRIVRRLREAFGDQDLPRGLLSASTKGPLEVFRRKF